jgi:hypothetical protein
MWTSSSILGSTGSSNRATLEVHRRRGRVLAGRGPAWLLRLAEAAQSILLSLAGG